jgi:hypothetical protein
MLISLADLASDGESVGSLVLRQTLHRCSPSGQADERTNGVRGPIGR